MPKKTVLAIDDDVTFRKHMTELLESAGYRVISAADGHEAVAMIEAHKSVIDLMIVDLCLPDANGLEIIADVARKEAPIKIVAATGVFDEMYLEIAKTIGADDAIRKPAADRAVVAVRLLQTVRRLLKEPAVASEPGQRLIVLADDDSTVRGYVRTVLHSAGYQVLEADDGLAALALIEKIGGALDLLVTDYEMPNMKGTDLVQAMRIKYPSVPVVYISGYASDLERRLDDAANACTFLSKPFLPTQLIEAVTRMMPKSSRAGGG